MTKKLTQIQIANKMLLKYAKEKQPLSSAKSRLGIRIGDDIYQLKDIAKEIHVLRSIKLPSGARYDIRTLRNNGDCYYYAFYYLMTPEDRMFIENDYNINSKHLQKKYKKKCKNKSLLQKLLDFIGNM